MSLPTFFIALCYINLIYASKDNIRCECTCCYSTTAETCKSMQLNSVISDKDHCQTNKCRDACRQHYHDCQSENGIIDGRCIQSSQ